MIISPLNYPGNKAKVVKQIIDVLPRNLDFFVDVFCGSGIVAVNSPAKNVICNDKSAHSIELLSYFYRTPTELILKNIADIIEKYGLTNSRLEPIGTYKEIRHEGLSVHNKKGFIKMKDDYNSNKSVDL
ncbi:MAG: DNA adenine methylase, partial [Firmicutes bacterium]|nr:DNA adenine methylase [Bacillota bacterium]